MRLTLGEKVYDLELNFGRIQAAQRRLCLSVWPVGIDYMKAAPADLFYRLFVAAADLPSLDAAYAAVTSEDEETALSVAVLQLLEAYQPEKMKALAEQVGKGVQESLKGFPSTSGSGAGPSLVSTSGSTGPTLTPVQNANGVGSPTNGKREKQRETTRRLV